MIDEDVLAHLHGHGVVAYPTSTLPGLACLPTSEALDALFALKQRSADKPVSLGVLSLDQAAALVVVPPEVHALEAAFPRVDFRSFSTRLNRLTRDWAGRAWRFVASPIRWRERWLRPWARSPQQAPTNRAKRRHLPLKKRGAVWGSLHTPCSKGPALGAWAAPSSTSPRATLVLK